MKYLTRIANQIYNARKSRHLITQMPTCLSTNPYHLKCHGLASRSARLLATAWLTYPADSSLPQKLRLNKSCQQAVDYARAMPLRVHLPEDRSYETPWVSALFAKYRYFVRICTFIALFSLISTAASAGVCTGRFPNPITDVCWECLFPISIGASKLSTIGLPDTFNPPSPICSCPNPLPRIGIAVGFWEPARLVDVTKRPFCFVNLGGLSIDPGIGIGTGKSPSDNQTSEADWHVHWYIYPLLYWLNLVVDFACLEVSGFDIAYITELDPLWQDDELTFLLNPEAVLFGNPIAQAACAADCIASSVYLPFDTLFWCAGCQGGMYPMNGKITGHIGSIQSSLLAAERMTYKLHREGVEWGTSGVLALCQPYPMPIIKKSQYRSQLINPMSTIGIGGCVPFGRTSTIYEFGKEIPIIGEDFGYLIWRKRNCCAF